jgi:hypothetical protein
MATNDAGTIQLVSAGVGLLVGIKQWRRMLSWSSNNSGHRHCHHLSRHNDGKGYGE